MAYQKLCPFFGPPDTVQCPMNSTRTCVYEDTKYTNKKLECLTVRASLQCPFMAILPVE